MSCFEAHYSLKSYKWCIREIRDLNKKNVHWVVKKFDNIYTCSNEVLPSGLHQVRGWIISHIITNKFIQVK